MMNELGITEKYKIHFINGKRYYEFDMTEKLPILDNTIPYYFRYKDIEIYETAWNRMALKILEALDSKYPKQEAWYLTMEYSWSKTEVFSRIKRTNFSPFKNIYLNTNHTSTHAMMSIQTVLEEFGVKLSDCFFLIRRHPSSEPTEAREYFRKQTIDEFVSVLKFRCFSEKRINTILSNFSVINKLLSKTSPGFDDFFLFDDYYYFINYKIKVQEEALKTFWNSHKNVEVVEKMLGYLDNFYKNKEFYKKVSGIKLNPMLKLFTEKEIKWLFENSSASTIVYTKLFARMSLMHEKTMNELGNLNNSEDFFKIVESQLGNVFYFKHPFISVNKDSVMSNDEIIIAYAYEKDEFSIVELNDYADKMHLKKLNNYIQFMIDCSEEYVQVSVDKMVRKEKIDLPYEIIEKVNKELKFYISSFGPVDTRQYSGYTSMPELGYKWSKYLLVGVIRTYLKHKFKISYNGSSYRSMDYIIELL